MNSKMPVFHKFASAEKLLPAGWTILLMFAVALQAMLMRCVCFFLYDAVLDLCTLNLPWRHR
ncbi:MAG: hypothetical protein WBX38_03355 [Candidatus Sulfotelmatobacter sp.]